MATTTHYLLEQGTHGSLETYPINCFRPSIHHHQSNTQKPPARYRDNKNLFCANNILTTYYILTKEQIRNWPPTLLVPMTASLYSKHIFFFLSVASSNKINNFVSVRESYLFRLWNKFNQPNWIQKPTSEKPATFEWRSPWTAVGTFGLVWSVILVFNQGYPVDS